MLRTALFFLLAGPLLLVGCDSNGMEVEDNCSQVRIAESGLDTGDIVILILNEGSSRVTNIEANFDLWMRWEEGSNSGTRIFEDLNVTADRLEPEQSADRNVPLGDLEHSFWPERQVQNVSVECQVQN